VDAPECSQRATRANRARSGICLSARRLRHKSRTGAVTQLAARCARGRPDPDFRGAVRALAERAIYAVVRCKVLVEGSLHSQLPSRMLMGFGLLSVVLAAFFLWRQRDIKRLFAYSSIEHMGIITFAFGMGGPVATFAALLHMTVHSTH